jgi:hypothetical protein
MSESPDIALSAERLDEVVQGMTYAELHQLKATITHRMGEMRTTGITQLRATIAEQAHLLGIEVSDLFPPKKARRGRPRKAEATA